jgi:hypothetical protein
MTLRGRCAISLDSRLYYERYGNRKQRGMLDLMNDVSLAPTSNGGHDVSPSVADNSATPEPVATVTITGDNTDDKDVNAGKTADDVFLSAVDGSKLGLKLATELHLALRLELPAIIVYRHYCVYRCQQPVLDFEACQSI